MFPAFAPERTSRRRYSASQRAASARMASDAPSSSSQTRTCAPVIRPAATTVGSTTATGSS